MVYVYQKSSVLVADLPEASDGLTCLVSQGEALNRGSRVLQFPELKRTGVGYAPV
jgi:hypothetical protein